MNDGASTSADYSFSFPPLKPQSVFQFEGYTSCGTSYNSYTLAASSLSHDPEDSKLSQVKLPRISQSWCLAADDASCSLESATDLSASHSTLMSNQWASTSSLGGSMVDPVEPDAVHTLESNLDFLVLQTWKEAPSIQPSKEGIGTGMASQPSSACPMKPIVPTLSPCKPKKKRVKKKTLKAANIPTLPLPPAGPTTQRRCRPHPAYLVSPSQIAMASFSTKSSPSDTLKIKKHQNVKPLSKKSRHPGLLRSLITPNLAAGGYPSQLRSPTYLADHLLNFDLPSYTPPPMLSPLRPGSGLYFNTLPQYQPCLPPPSIYSACLDGKDGISLTLDNTVVSIKPKINVGSRFQAEIPPLRNPLLILYDEHPAQLVWAPWGDLHTNPETQQNVTEFLNMCCSSVLPGGGTNTELALHFLHEVQGDILAALDLLLVRGDYRTSCHPLSDYHYTGSDHWTAQEMRVFQKALLNQTKDFQFIHKALQTKSVAQCVEYYYTMKKLKKFKKRCRRIENNDGAGKNSDFHSASTELYEDKTKAWKSISAPKGMLVGHSDKNYCESIEFNTFYPFEYFESAREPWVHKQ
ncbi:hypothetical protein QTP70_004241 [Hemibagrus guttatus]|uniref:Uncharacterized protein n=1 Tax=Hemibagrus guttatus TaxID=175788 RepID=A0AAE0PVS1_9TELE|nr:hypothetical protein QTP70_004241 [Hemibagrus guttatus]